MFQIEYQWFDRQIKQIKNDNSRDQLDKGKVRIYLGHISSMLNFESSPATTEIVIVSQTTTLLDFPVKYKTLPDLITAFDAVDRYGVLSTVK